MTRAAASCTFAPWASCGHHSLHQAAQEGERRRAVAQTLYHELNTVIGRSCETVMAASAGGGFIECKEAYDSYGRDTWVDHKAIPSAAKVGDTLKFGVTLSEKEGTLAPRRCPWREAGVAAQRRGRSMWLGRADALEVATLTCRAPHEAGSLRRWRQVIN
ncbi:unnamed protein product [Prorocentrum cordatum]|uniref:Uncharacterized protein n=1 Tax=Prorocentrum cordatum TaxID=2364126 RepID=A0ABN9WWM4_9DINO|nr:unnamed protein product [Polarella glacialis]